MQEKIRVDVRSDQLEGKKVWLIYFRYNENLKEILKTKLKARWNPTLKCWWVKYAQNVISELRVIAGIELNISYSSDNKTGNCSEEKDVLMWKYEGASRTGSGWQLGLNVNAINDLVQWQKRMESLQYAPNTIETYISAIKLFLIWLSGKNHKEVKKQDIENYMHYLVKERAVSRSYQNTHINALKFFFKEIMSIHLSPEMIIRPRKEYKLPHYLTREEVSKIFYAIGNLKHRAMISLVYACGLRLGEVIRINLKDIDPAQKLLMIRQSKGNKDRVVPIPDSILYLLNDYANAFKPQQFLFEGQKAGESYSERSLQEVFKTALRKSGITKQEATLHWLRHSYATHLLEMGTNIRDLQMLLGHKNVKTTEAYTHVSATRFARIVSPFDVLPTEKSSESSASNTKKLYF